MTKYIDKILYYFGYAPILLREEIKYIIVNKDINFDIVRAIEHFDNDNHYQFHKNEAKRKLLEEVEKRIEWVYIGNNFPGMFYSISAELILERKKNE